MYRQPLPQLTTIMKLRPSLVIVHAEADGNFYELAEQLRAANIRVGLALLKQTTVTSVAAVLPEIDHILIFSGELGHFGGKLDTQLLRKVQIIQSHFPDLEIGWDGGINDQNAAILVRHGVSVLNVGGFIQKASNPLHAYATLKEVITKSKHQ